MAPYDDRLQDIGEAGLLARIFRLLPPAGAGVVVGPGDDAAVLAGSGADAVVFSADAAVQGIHFDLALMSPADVGWRLTCANLSDLAAMGATPWAAVITLAAPGETPAAVVEGFYEGAAALARDAGLALVGGDVVGSASGLFFAMAVLGRAAGGKLLTRSGAVPGDCLMLSGEVGGSRAGLDILRRQGEAAAAAAEDAVARYRRPTPRLACGRSLLERGLASAAIDTSDSLSESCAHLARMSGVGVVLDAAAIPIAAGARDVAASRGVDALAYALAAGEDFELLWSCPAVRAAEAVAAADATGIGARVVGRIVEPARGLVLVRDGVERPLVPAGYVHF